MQIKFYDEVVEVRIWIGKYQNGRPAIQLVTDDEPFGKLTINIPEAPLADDEICVQNWSENELWVPQVLEVLPEVFQDTGRTFRTRYVEAPIWKFNPSKLPATPAEDED